jgi:hypothetical protein
LRENFLTFWIFGKNCFIIESTLYRKTYRYTGCSHLSKWLVLTHWELTAHSAAHLAHSTSHLAHSTGHLVRHSHGSHVLSTHVHVGHHTWCRHDCCWTSHSRIREHHFVDIHIEWLVESLLLVLLLFLFDVISTPLNSLNL